MSDSEPIAFRRPTTTALAGASISSSHSFPKPYPIVAFSRSELSMILNVYGRRVADGDWRDYALDMGRETAVFSIFRRASEVPIYRIEKTPKLARRQGAYAVVSATGHILKRGHELVRVLTALEKKVRLVD